MTVMKWNLMVYLMETHIHQQNTKNIVMMVFPTDMINLEHIKHYVQKVLQKSMKI